MKFAKIIVRTNKEHPAPHVTLRALSSLFPFPHIITTHTPRTFPLFPFGFGASGFTPAATACSSMQTIIWKKNKYNNNNNNNKHTIPVIKSSKQQQQQQQRQHIQKILRKEK